MADYFLQLLIYFSYLLYMYNVAPFFYMIVCFLLCIINLTHYIFYDSSSRIKEDDGGLGQKS